MNGRDEVIFGLSRFSPKNTKIPILGDGIVWVPKPRTIPDGAKLPLHPLPA